MLTGYETSIDTLRHRGFLPASDPLRWDKIVQMTGAYGLELLPYFEASERFVDLQVETADRFLSAVTDQVKKLATTPPTAQTDQMQKLVQAQEWVMAHLMPMELPQEHRAQRRREVQA